MVSIRCLETFLSLHFFVKGKSKGSSLLLFYLSIGEKCVIDFSGLSVGEFNICRSMGWHSLPCPWLFLFLILLVPAGVCKRENAASWLLSISSHKCSSNIYQVFTLLFFCCALSLGFSNKWKNYKMRAKERWVRCIILLPLVVTHHENLRRQHYQAFTAIRLQGWRNDSKSSRTARENTVREFLEHAASAASGNGYRAACNKPLDGWFWF